MSKWRVQFYVETPQVNDSALSALCSKSHLYGTNVYNRPFDHTEGFDDGKYFVNAHIQFTSQSEAETFFNSMKAFGQTSGLPMGVGRIGEGVSDTANLHGWVKLMLCTHDDAVIVPCTQSSYQQFVF